MRSLLRLLILSVALSVLAVFVLVSFSDSGGVTIIDGALRDNHWKFTALRVVFFICLLAGMYGLRRWKESKSSQVSSTSTRDHTNAQLLRIGLWLIVLEVSLGQGLVRRFVELVSL